MAPSSILGCVDGLLHSGGIPASVNEMIGGKLGDEIEFEVFEIGIEKRRILLRMPMDDTEGK